MLVWHKDVVQHNKALVVLRDSIDGVRGRYVGTHYTYVFGWTIKTYRSLIINRPDDILSVQTCPAKSQPKNKWCLCLECWIESILPPIKHQHYGRSANNVLLYHIRGISCSCFRFSMLKNPFKIKISFETPLHLKPLVSPIIHVQRKRYFQEQLATSFLPTS